VSWSDLLAALALYLVLEGILPFLNPQAMKRVLTAMATFSDRRLRAVGAGEHGGRRAAALFCSTLTGEIAGEQDDDSQRGRDRRSVGRRR
jgi:uncharacterized protein YjeT (DUF2065 family)